jgi:hypothetical protein
MRIPALVALSVAALATIAQAQTAREITFFSNNTPSGAKYTVTGPRTNVAMPFVPRSAILQGGGTWQVCSGQDYTGKCLVLSSNVVRNLGFGAIRSVRPVGATAPAPAPWKEVARLDVRDRAERDTAAVNDRQTSFRQIRVCSERRTVRIRRAEVQFANGDWQRLFVPLALSQGKCSNAIDLLKPPRRLRAVRFEYEAWTPGMARATISVKALPSVTPQPR